MFCEHSNLRGWHVSNRPEARRTASIAGQGSPAMRNGLDRLSYMHQSLSGMEVYNNTKTSKGDDLMSKKLFVQDAKFTPQKQNKRSERTSIKLRKNLFKIIFKGVEFIWMLVQIVQYILQIFR